MNQRLSAPIIVLLLVLAAFFGEGLLDVGSPWYSHAVRWRNNRRTHRFFETDVLAEADGRQFERLAGALPPEFAGWEPLAQAQYNIHSLALSRGAKNALA